MDLSLWDAPDDQAPNPSTEEDDWKYYFSLGYGRDMIEENALNEKYCVQVLKKLIEKANEDITELEEEIVLLQCELAWIHEDWSKSCSNVLQERIYCLDLLIRTMMKDSSVRLVHLPTRLHDLLKPLHERYLLGQDIQATKRVNKRKSVNTVANSYHQSREKETNTSSEGVKAPDVAILASELNRVIQIFENSSKKRRPIVKIIDTKALATETKDEKKTQQLNMIEENALNEKYCVQVLKKLIEKADEDIIKLEEEIVLLQCGLAWIHEDWSKSCSVVLKKEIYYLNVLIHAPASSVRLVRLPKRLIDLLKPLHESYVSGEAKSSVLLQKHAARKKTKHWKQVNQRSHANTTLPQLAAERNTHESKVANSYQQPRETEAMTSSRVKPAESNFTQITKGLSKKRRPFVKVINTKDETKDEKNTQQISEIVLQKSSPYTKPSHKLTLADLRAIARDRNFRGFKRFRKEELRKQLGLDPPDNAK